MKLTIHCTDTGKSAEADLHSHREKKVLEVFVQGIKIILRYEPKVDTYVGNMNGLEFTVKRSDVPEEYHYKEYRRR